MIWFLLVKMIGKTRRAVITVGFFDWVVLKGLIMSSFSIVFISRLAGHLRQSTLYYPGL